ncbi:nuclear transport factor 2 family protein [Amycolatopsis sp. K13G38]|uniref:Nuclear transport factor 2 family protein n=1 Tax=Amycolatopsis acididurans TaxID=2724524 RepID=A0ABX1J888_9PSEU|nr:nuclear transport factor 2 family protein [Amycolatopsis acididurans]NKQ55511.1 nuclear transport factor 2 family protein [Amycolatopsis acididurans]
MEDLQRLVIEHGCQKLMARYCLHLDHLELDQFAGLWAPDGIYKPAAASEPIVGRTAILEWAHAYPKHRLGRHLSANEVVEVIDREHATGTSYAVVFREPDPRPGVLSARVTPRSVAEYTDEFRLTPEGWRFASRVYRINFLQAEESNRPAG